MQKNIILQYKRVVRGWQISHIQDKMSRESTNLHKRFHTLQLHSVYWSDIVFNYPHIR